MTIPVKSTWVPTDLGDDLVAWWDFTDGSKFDFETISKLTTVKDKSDNQNHLTQSTSTNKPAYGGTLATRRLDGRWTTQFDQAFPHWMEITDDIEIIGRGVICVLKQNNGTTSTVNQVMGHSTVNRSLRHHEYAAPHRCQITGSPDSLGQPTSNSKTDTGTEWRILTWMATSTQGQCGMDGGRGTITNHSVSSFIVDRVGRRNGTTDTLDADIAELIVVELDDGLAAASSDENVNKIEGYLAHKYGLEANLNSNSVYLDNPPFSDFDLFLADPDRQRNLLVRFPGREALTATDFDGSTECYERAGAWSGVSDSKTGTFAVFIKPTDRSDGAAEQYVFNMGTAGKLQIKFGAGGTFRHILKGTTGTVLLQHDDTGYDADVDDNVWQMYIGSWDLANGVAHLYKNNTSNQNITTSPVDAVVDWTSSEERIGCLNAGASDLAHFDGEIAYVYLSQTYYDIRLTKNRRLFISKDNAPVYPSQKLIDEAILCSVDGSGTNLGSGGDLTIVGTPTQSTVTDVDWLRMLYYAKHGYYDPVDDAFYEPRITSDLLIEKFSNHYMFGEPDGGPGKLTVDIINIDGALDAYIQKPAIGHRIKAWFGELSADKADYRTVFRGQINKMFMRGEKKFVVEALDSSCVSLKNEPIATSYYTDATTWPNLPDDREDRIYPISLGNVFHAPMPLVDTTNLTYHYSSLADAQNGILVMYDQGVSISYTDDNADVRGSTVDADAATAGKITALLVSGAFNLFSTSASADTVAECIIHLMMDYFGMDQEDIDIHSFWWSLNSSGLSIDSGGAWSAQAGAFYTTAWTYLEALYEFCKAGNMMWTMTREGQLRVTHLVDLSGTDDYYDNAKIVTLPKSRIKSVEVIPWQKVVTEVSVGYARYWHVFTDGEIAGSVNDEDRANLQQEYRIQHYVATDERRLKNPVAVNAKLDVATGSIGNDTEDPSDDREFIPTLLTNKSDALDMATHIVDNLLDGDKFLYRVKAIFEPGIVEIGDVMNIEYDRYGLDSGKRVMVVGIKERWLKNNSELLLWG